MFKKTYTEPAIYVEDVVVENGIAQSYQAPVIDDWAEDENALEF